MKAALVRRLEAGLLRVLSRERQESPRRLLVEVDELFRELRPVEPALARASPRLGAVLELTAWTLALHRVRQGGARCTVAETRGLVVGALETSVERYPRLLLHAAGRLRFTPGQLRRKARELEAVGRLELPFGWDGRLVSGPGRSLEYRVEYRRCGALEFLRAHGEEGLAPAICALDFVESRALGLGLRRRGTLAEGCGLCDFHYRWRAGARG